MRYETTTITMNRCTLRRARGTQATPGAAMSMLTAAGCIAVLAVAAACMLPNAARAQDVRAATSPRDPQRVVLLWSGDSTARGPLGFNVYRRAAGESGFTLLTPSPLAVVTDCAEFERRIPRASALGRRLAGTFLERLPDGTRRERAALCSITGILPPGDDWRRLETISLTEPTLAGLLAHTYEDRAVTRDTRYVYRVVPVIGGHEAAAYGVDSVAITAGRPDAIPVPANPRTTPQERAALIYWDQGPPAAPFFNLYRSESAGGPFIRVNEVSVAATMRSDDRGRPFPVPAGVYQDYTHYDSLTRYPVAGMVDGVSVPPLINGRTYYYQVAFTDFLGNEGPRSAVTTCVPVDVTPPAVPQELVVTAVESASGFQLRWPAVMRDQNGHPEDLRAYEIHRYSSLSDDRTRVMVAEAPQPTGADSTTFVTFIDSSAGLRSVCDPKTYYYRLRAMDRRGNPSAMSAAQGAALRDTTPPSPPRNLTGTGDAGSVKLNWQPNDECDIDNYLVYRALCDYGRWLECDTMKATRQKEESTPGRPLDCGGPFALLGSVPHTEAVHRAATGAPMFVDETIPAGSPLCYAYVVKAQDHSQNISGRMPLPDPAHEQIICVRLRDTTAPEPAVISGLFARDGAIRVEYIGPPVQDIAAYHVYRAVKRDGAYEWIGGATVVPPPGRGEPLAERYRGHAPECGAIPLAGRPFMASGTFVDTAIDARATYWYKVLGVDHDGNEAHLTDALAVSTFTFESARTASPAITGVEMVEGPCGIKLTWTSPYAESTGMVGIVIFRASAMEGPYLQLNSVVRRGATFTDNSTARNHTYWYRIAALKRDGTLSELSTPRNATHP